MAKLSVPKKSSLKKGVVANNKKTSVSSKDKKGLKTKVSLATAKKTDPKKSTKKTASPSATQALASPASPKLTAKAAAKPGSKPSLKVSKPKAKKPVKVPPKALVKKASSAKAKPEKKTPAPQKSSPKKVAKSTPKKEKVTKPAPKKKIPSPVAAKKNTPASAQKKPAALKKEGNPFEIPLKFKKTKIEEAPLPKFKTKVSIAYNPEYVQSVLQKKEEENTWATLVRYSDAELEEFKEILLSKLEEAKAELIYVQNMLSKKGRNIERTHNVMEDGQINMEQENLTQIARRQSVFIDHLEKALIRIENKTYGICRATGKLIDKDRLRAVPHATLSFEAKMSGLKNKGH